MEMCNIWTTLARAVAPSLAGDADARLKCSVNARRRDTDTSERQKNETFNAKQNTQPLSNAQRRRVCRTSGGLNHRCGDLQIFAGNGNFSIRIMSF